MWERVAGSEPVHGLLVFPGDVVDAQLVAHTGAQLCAVAVAADRCALCGVKLS